MAQFLKPEELEKLTADEEARYFEELDKEFGGAAAQTQEQAQPAQEETHKQTLSKTNHLGLRRKMESGAPDPLAGTRDSNETSADDPEQGSEEETGGAPAGITPQDEPLILNKFKSYGDLEKSYLELEKKLGQHSQDQDGADRIQTGGVQAAQPDDLPFDPIPMQQPDALTAEEQSTIANAVYNSVRNQLAAAYLDAGEEFPATDMDWRRLERQNKELFDRTASLWNHFENKATEQVTKSKKFVAELPGRNRAEFEAGKKALEESYGLGDRAGAYYKELLSKHGGDVKTGKRPNEQYFVIDNGYAVLRRGALETFAAVEKQSDLADALTQRKNRIATERAKSAGAPNRSISAAGGGQQPLNRNIPSPATWNNQAFKDSLSATAAGRKQLETYRGRIGKLPEKERVKYFPETTFR